MAPPRRQTRRRKKSRQILCSIPIPDLASKSSSNNADADADADKDFYKYVNGDWLNRALIPPHLNDISVSTELEKCISNVTKKILEDCSTGIFADIRSSCLHNKDSLEYLRGVLKDIHCIQTPADVFDAVFTLCKRGIPGLFDISTYAEPDTKTVRLFLSASLSSLKNAYHSDTKIIYHYKALLHKLGKMLDIEGLDKVIPTEKALSIQYSNIGRNVRTKVKGSGLERKFPGIPWGRLFESIGASEWKKMVMYYTDPSWFRYIARKVNSIPVKYWKWYIARCYIMNALPYLPSPYSDFNYEFSGKMLMGQKDKMPKEDLLVKVVHTYMNDDFSQLFWEKAGDPKLPTEVDAFAKTLVESAKERLETVDWLKYKTRKMAIKKVDNMIIQTVRPAEWTEVPRVTLDPRNLLKNIHNLGSRSLVILLGRLGKEYNFWEEPLYLVNAFYFGSTNKMIIPYASCLPPFYSKDSGAAWNYGSLGSIIGHELCHGFDEEGKEIDEEGEKKRWWTRTDNLHYNKRTKDLMKLFSHEKIHGKHVSGKHTLSENIADLGGLSISLQALKDALQNNGIVDPIQVKEEYKKFFASFAVSWRTKARDKKMDRALKTDVHSPPYLRVNLVVRQFDEWYFAFDVREDSPMYVKPEDRIRIF
jgi:predicted metalloendopeptidase